MQAIAAHVKGLLGGALMCKLELQSWNTSSYIGATLHSDKNGMRQ